MKAKRKGPKRATRRTIQRPAKLTVKQAWKVVELGFHLALLAGRRSAIGMCWYIGELRRADLVSASGAANMLWTIQQSIAVADCDGYLFPLDKHGDNERRHYAAEQASKL